MIDSKPCYVEERNIGRRRDDRIARERIKRHRMLFHVGQILTSEMNLDVLFEVIMDETNKIMGTDRSTVFLHDEKSGELWSLVATGMKRNEIRIPDTYGVAGWSFHNRKLLVINDAYNDARFYGEIDKKSGFRTRNILCIPLANRKDERIGALQVLNKRSGDFTDDDISLLVSLSYYVAVALENARLYEELKVLDKAKERVINHLSHEMRTPLSIISGVLENIRRKVGKGTTKGLEDTISRGNRNVERLFDLQRKVDDILNQRPIDEREKVISLIEGAVSLVEEMKEEDDLQTVRDLLERVSKRLETLYAPSETHMEKISLDRFLQELCDDTIASMGARELEIIRDFARGISLNMDRNTLRTICGGLLRNAVENTPDEGRIRIRTVSGRDLIRIEVQDCGTGITVQNQKMIFGGFFHTQETNVYASKKPYRFNAGGSGADLLRIKALSERLGFRVDFASTRCPALPEDRDLCPGRIASCTKIARRNECLSSGGSTFALTFPVCRFG
ncbi:MAG: GAF domain-containing protein [Deltaproteobacteria bacterium]|nr:GAF domain-containing protein [Deltaproteobacteria bacterium]